MIYFVAVDLFSVSKIEFAERLNRFGDVINNDFGFFVKTSVSHSELVDGLKLTPKDYYVITLIDRHTGAGINQRKEVKEWLEARL